LSKILLNLQNILEAIEKIEIYTADFSDFESFAADDLHFDATMMKFINIGEAIKKIPGEYKLEHKEIPWQDALDFRNIAAHDYFGLNTQEVWQIVRLHLPHLKLGIEALISASPPDTHTPVKT